MRRALNIKLHDDAIDHVKKQAAALGITQTEVVRQAIYRDAAVAEIRDQTRQAVQQEFDLLFAKIAADFSSELKQQIDELREVQRSNFSKFAAAVTEQINSIKKG